VKLGGRRSLLYELYVGSPVWRARRWWWFVTSDRRCARCRRRLVLHGGGPATATVHHRTYARAGARRGGRRARVRARPGGGVRGHPGRTGLVVDGRAGRGTAISRSRPGVGAASALGPDPGRWLSAGEAAGQPVAAAQGDASNERWWTRSRVFARGFRRIFRSCVCAGRGTPRGMCGGCRRGRHGVRMSSCGGRIWSPSRGSLTGWSAGRRRCSCVCASRTRRWICRVARCDCSSEARARCGTRCENTPANGVRGRWSVRRWRVCSSVAKWRPSGCCRVWTRSQRGRMRFSGWSARHSAEGWANRRSRGWTRRRRSHIPMTRIRGSCRRKGTCCGGWGKTASSAITAT